jgi:hypothetical protein
LAKDQISLTLSQLFSDRHDAVDPPVDLGLTPGISVEALDMLLSSGSVVVESEDALLQMIIRLGPAYYQLLHHIHPGLLTPDGLPMFAHQISELRTELIWAGLPTTIPLCTQPPFSNDSVILSRRPSPFEIFRGRQFRLLWRGSRDGFGAAEFHKRCDGRPRTLTIVRDTQGNIFGGFAAVAWESRVWNGKWGGQDNCFKADSSLESWLFTVVNPHGMRPRRFPLKPETKSLAIICDASRGPDFGRGDLVVRGACRARPNSYHGSFGYTYQNDTGIAGSKLLTGDEYFNVDDVEVFEVV